ncbi:MAG: TonB-dependent receptor [Desulfobulbaceae bacterium]|nr:TonB-dependent receptor [Desulfobulbaceae bacterium]
MNKIPIFLLPLLFAASFSSAQIHNISDDRLASLEDLLLFYEEEELFIATRHETPVHTAPAIASVVTDREIRNMGARTLLDVLKKIPGIGVSIGHIPVVRSVEMRGIRTLMSEKILIMIDGHRVNDSLSGTAAIHFGDMSVDFIKRVEVVRGPGSALFGANAFLGVVNIVTKSAEDINGVQVTTGGGSFDTLHGNVLFGHSVENVKMSGYYDYLDTDGPTSFIEQDVLGNSGDTLNWQEKEEMGLNVSWRDFTLRGRYQTNENGPYIGTASALNDESVLRFGTAGYLDLDYVKTIDQGTDVRVRVYGDYVAGENYFEIFPEGFPGYPQGMIGDPQSKQKLFGGEMALNYELANHQFTTGGMFENQQLYGVKHRTNYHPLTFAPLGSVQDISDWGNFNEETTRDIWALYLQDIWNINNKATLTVGIRQDHYSDFGGSTNPRAGFVWEFSENSTLKLLYGSAFRAPSLTELYQKNNPSNIGNLDLIPEEIKTWEAGIEQRIHKNVILRLDYFYSKMENLIIIGDKPSVTEPAQNENKGQAKVDGIEAELHFDLGSNTYGFLNYCYQHPRDGYTGEHLPDVASHKINALLNVAPWKYLNANVSLSWIGERSRAAGDAREDLSPSTLIDLSLIVKEFYKTLEIRGTVYNLFDETYLDPSPYPVQVANDYPTNERMFLVEARFTF